MKIALIGCTGLVGSHLIKQLLSEKHELILFSRNPDKAKPCFCSPLIEVQKWDPDEKEKMILFFDKADAVVNLAGAGIADKLWTQKRKQLLYDSRIQTTQAITSFINQSQTPPSVLVSASAIGIYGNTHVTVDENTPAGDGFLSKICRDWENEANQARTRVVNLRIGHVFAPDGGLLRKMRIPFSLFIGGPLGSGSQGISWIDIEDLIKIILFSIKNKEISGPLNAVAPNPISMKVFCSTLGELMNRPSWLAVPSFILSLLPGEMGKELFLSGQFVKPSRLEELGYQYIYTTVTDSLNKNLN